MGAQRAAARAASRAAEKGSKAQPSAVAEPQPPAVAKPAQPAAAETPDCCPICFETLTENVCSLPCHHKYRVQCICGVLTVALHKKAEATCPVCRAPFDETAIRTPLMGLRALLAAAPRNYEQGRAARILQQAKDRVREIKIENVTGRNALTGMLLIKTLTTLKTSLTAEDQLFKWSNFWTLTIVVTLAVGMLLWHIFSMPMTPPHVSAAHRKLQATLDAYDRARAGRLPIGVTLDLGSVCIGIATMSLFFKWLNRGLFSQGQGPPADV